MDCSSISLGREVVDSGKLTILGGEEKLWVGEGDLSFLTSRILLSNLRDCNGEHP